MKINAKNILKGILLSVVTLSAGFIALAIPFHIFDGLSKNAVEALFIGEIVAYIAIALIFLVVRDKNEQRKKKQNRRHSERCRKIERFQEEWINIAA